MTAMAEVWRAAAKAEHWMRMYNLQAEEAKRQQWALDAGEDVRELGLRGDRWIRHQGAAAKLERAAHRSEMCAAEANRWIQRADDAAARVPAVTTDGTSLFDDLRGQSAIERMSMYRIMPDLKHGRYVSQSSHVKHVGYVASRVYVFVKHGIVLFIGLVLLSLLVQFIRWLF